MVVLHEGKVQPRRRHARGIPGFAKPSPNITETRWSQDQDARQVCLFNNHGDAVACLRGRIWASHQRGYGICNGAAQFGMGGLIEMHTVNGADRDHLTSIQKGNAARPGKVGIKRGKRL